MPIIKLPYYIIESKRPFFVCIDPSLNSDYKDLLNEEVANKLPKPNPMKRGRAFMYQTTEMLEVEVYDEDTATSTRKFRDEVILAQADERGRIMIEKDKPDLARKILRALRILDGTINLDPSGWMLPEDDPAKRNLGGRPPKLVK